MANASGTFEVELEPAPAFDEAPAMGRMLIRKRFAGPLVATSRGQMLALHTEVKGSAGYVALEVVEGTLDEREGTFALAHLGTMQRGEGELTVTVVPDSGTGALAGISGTMNIDVKDGVHHYAFDYALP